ncbi:MAG: rod shape-determining protein MreC [Acidobacteriota bacterium]
MNERRARWLFLAVLGAQLLALSLQVPDPERRSSFPESLGLRFLGPLARAVDSGADGASSVRESFRRRAALVEENRHLQSELERLRLEVMRLRESDDEARRLAAALDYGRQSHADLRVADVVYGDFSSWLRTLVVRTGSARVAINQAVVAPAGLVGRVILVAGPYAKVQIVIDRTASVSAYLEPSHRQGIVRGDGNGGLELDYVLQQAEVGVGDRVLTAGIDGIYPRGIPIGTVTSVQPGGELFHAITLAPAVDFGKLEQVYIVDSQSLPQSLKETATGARP